MTADLAAIGMTTIGIICLTFYAIVRELNPYRQPKEHNELTIYPPIEKMNEFNDGSDIGEQKH